MDGSKAAGKVGFLIDYCPENRQIPLLTHPFYPVKLIMLFPGRLAQLVRALARHARGQWFESTTAHHSPAADFAAIVAAANALYRPQRNRI